MKPNFCWMLCLLIISSGVYTENCQPKIAIIGGGIGGASTSYYLSELFKKNVEIDLFEPNVLGGRLATVNIGGHDYESGGSIIHSQNKYMQNFAKLLGLKHRPSTHQRAGIWNGEEFVFEESYWNAISLAKLIYRYGFQPIKLTKYITSILTDFEKIYDLQDSGKSFENVTALLSAMNTDFPKLLTTSGKRHFLSLGYNEKFIDELINTAMTVNYGQDTSIQSFVVCVALAATTGNLWAVQGGNKKVAEHLIYRNPNVKVIPSFVTKIVQTTIDNTNKFVVHHVNNDTGTQMNSDYDIVVLATPLTHDAIYPITFEGFLNKEFIIPGKYHTTIATFVQGILQQSYFGLDDQIDAILSCNPNHTIISSVGKLETVEGSVKNTPHVWKIFTNAAPKKALLERMFSNIKELKQIDWKAYPQYTTKFRHDQFKLYNGLYHVNAIEWAASAMEMSAIGGRNVAILAHKEFIEQCDQINEMKFMGRDEL